MIVAFSSGGIRSIGLASLVLAGSLRCGESVAAEPVVGWQDVQAAVQAGLQAGARPSSTPSSSSFSSMSESERSRGVGGFSLDPIGPALPPLRRDAFSSSYAPVQASSLAGISSSVVPAITGDLYRTQPVMDMRIIGESLGQASSLRLSRPPVGVPVGSTTVKTASAGINK